MKLQQVCGGCRHVERKKDNKIQSQKCVQDTMTAQTGGHRLSLEREWVVSQLEGSLDPSHVEKKGRPARQGNCRDNKTVSCSEQSSWVSGGVGIKK